MPLEIGGAHEQALLTLAADWTLRTFPKDQLIHFRNDGYCEEITNDRSEMAACAFVQLADTERFSFMKKLIWEPTDLAKEY